MAPSEVDAEEATRRRVGSRSTAVTWWTYGTKAVDGEVVKWPVGSCFRAIVAIFCVVVWISAKVGQEESCNIACSPSKGRTLVV